MLKIRRYRPEDNAAVKELHFAGIAQMRELSPVPGNPDPRNYSQDMDDIENIYLNNGNFLVGLRGEEIVAIGAVKKLSATSAEIKRLRVRRDCQRKGFAKAIMVKLIESAKQLGYTELCLDTLVNNTPVNNTPAQQLFESLGFTKMKQEMLGPFELIYYGKKLNEEDKDKEGEDTPHPNLSHKGRGVTGFPHPRE